MRCPWMGMNGLRNLARTLETGDNEIVVEESVRKKALIPLQRMMDFAKDYSISTMGKANA